MDRETLGILAALSFLPPLVYMAWLRHRETRHREPWSALLGAFIYGGTAGVALGIALHYVFQVQVAPYANFGFSQALVAAVVAAPIVEELSKGLGLGFLRGRIIEVEDGVVYGATLGLGFASTENFVYGLSALADGGQTVAITTVTIRVFSSMLLHAAASSLIGFGFGIAVVRGWTTLTVLPFYLMAVLLHAFYNFVASLSGLAGLGGALVIGSIVARRLHRRIAKLDAASHQEAE